MLTSSSQPDISYAPISSTQPAVSNALISSTHLVVKCGRKTVQTAAIQEEMVDCILVRNEITEASHPLFWLNNRIERIELQQITGYSDELKNTV